MITRIEEGVEGLKMPTERDFFDAGGAIRRWSENVSNKTNTSSISKNERLG